MKPIEFSYDLPAKKDSKVKVIYEDNTEKEIEHYEHLRMLRDDERSYYMEIEKNTIIIKFI